MTKVCEMAMKWLPDTLNSPLLSEYVGGAPPAPPPVMPSAYGTTDVAPPAGAPVAPSPTRSPVQQEPVAFASPGAGEESSPLLNAAVTVNYRNSGNLFPGKISAVNADGTYNIAYDDGDRFVVGEYTATTLIYFPLLPVSPAPVSNPRYTRTSILPLPSSIS